MREFWDFVVQTAAVAKMVDTIRSIMTRKAAIIAGAAAITVTVAVAAFLIGRNVGPPPKSAPVTQESPTSLGGVDLANYCTSISYETNSEAFCSSKIDLDQACDWQYGQNGLRIKLTSGDPYSGVCHDPQAGKKLGGISDMPGFCRSHFRGNVEASVVAGEWLCREPINMNLACAVQYRRQDVTAHRDGNGIWHCYLTRA